MLSAAAAVSSTTDRPRIVMWHSQRRQTNCTTLLIDTRRGGVVVGCVYCYTEYRHTGFDVRTRWYRTYMQLSKAIETQRKQQAVGLNVDKSMRAMRFYPAPAGSPQVHNLHSRYRGVSRNLVKFVSRSHWNPAAVPRDFTAPTPVPFDTLLRKRRVWIYGRFH